MRAGQQHKTAQRSHTYTSETAARNYRQLFTRDAERRKQLRTKKKSRSCTKKAHSYVCLFTSTAVSKVRTLRRRVRRRAAGGFLTYAVDEFVSPRVKFLPKAAPVDCALQPFALTRHFLTFLYGGHQHGNRKRQCVSE